MHSNLRSAAPECCSLLGVVACEEVGTPLSIDATGELAVQAYLDRNGSGELEAGSTLPAVGLRLACCALSGRHGRHV
jgi:hypothetical protein